MEELVEQVEILKQQLRDGELPRHETYVWNSELSEFEVAEKDWVN